MVYDSCALTIRPTPHPVDAPDAAYNDAPDAAGVCISDVRDAVTSVRCGVVGEFRRGGTAGRNWIHRGSIPASGTQTAYVEVSVTLQPDFVYSSC